VFRTLSEYRPATVRVQRVLQSETLEDPAGRLFEGVGVTHKSEVCRVGAVNRVFAIGAEEVIGREVVEVGDLAEGILDEILLAELLRRADGGSGDWMRKRFETEIRHGGIRRMKETLFLTGRLDVTVADQSVSIELPEFLNNDRVKRFSLTIEEAIRKFLCSVDSSWQKADQALLVLTGGGASLPMIKDLVNKRWELGGRSITFRAAEAVPEAIQEFDADFQKEYPQLAVAIGGALPVLDERFIIREFAGAAPKPGPLERFQMTGLQKDGFEYRSTTHTLIRPLGSFTSHGEDPAAYGPLGTDHPDQ